MNTTINQPVRPIDDSDKRVLENYGMKLFDEKGILRPFDDIENEFINGVWRTLSSHQRIDSLIVVQLVRYRLRNGYE